ncbi:hypothetical protein DdX_17324 [Ditylenchus destructor]|uniref:Uncharacterized protein n=1 Tax=Ditylenchus destructor TaxID=166010 RepID=A0AAD4QTH7_9BILA|nr:hypothetical protein DdX_17324 [Ditylenchus destructor]
MKSLIISFIIFMALFRQSVGYDGSCDKCLKYAGVACTLKMLPPCGYFNIQKYCKDGLKEDGWYCPESFIRYSNDLKRLLESGKASAEKICDLLKECP